MGEIGNTLLIINPVAQSGRGAAAGTEAIELLTAQMGDKVTHLDVAYTQGPRDAVGIAAQASGHDTVIALGGDGLIHETAIGLMSLPPDARPTMGIIPVGSGNDYARTLDISRDVPTAVSQLFEAQRMMVDVGCCNGVYYLETLSFGLDAAIALGTVEARKHTDKTDTALYFDVGIDQLLHHFDTYEYTMQLDGGEPIEGKMKMLAVQIGVTYGGGFKVTPDAKVDDGLFDICTCNEKISLPRAIYTFAKAKDGKHVGARSIEFYRASRVYLRFDRRPPCQMDGEEHIADEYDISILQRVLPVLTRRYG